MDRTRTMAQAGRGVLVAPIVQAMFQLAEWSRRRQIRQAYGPISETLLRDIGLTPHELEEALAKPMTEDASDALVRAAVARAGNW
jgi:uncharacterized protein YjiS (DUF1127 family)